MGEFAGRGLHSHTRPLARESSSRHRTFQPGLCPWMPFGAAVYAMAVHYETVEGGDESADKWAIMVRNAGNEGDCSDQKDHPMTPGMGSLSLYLRHPVSYDSAEPDPNARYVHRPAPVASFSARLGNRPSQPIAEDYRFDDDA